MPPNKEFQGTIKVSEDDHTPSTLASDASHRVMTSS